MNDPEARALLLRYAKSEIPHLRYSTVVGLRIRQATDADAVRACMALARDRVPLVQDMAIEALGVVGRRSREVIPILIDALGAERFSTRAAALDAIRTARPSDAKVVLALLAMAVNDANVVNRIQAVEAIVRIGRPAVQSLERALSERLVVNPRNRLAGSQSAAKALAQIPDGVGVLQRALKAEDNGTRTAAKEGMKFIPLKLAGSVESDLLEALEEDFARATVMDAIERLGLRSERVIRAMERVIRRHEHCRFSAKLAISILERNGLRSKKARAILEEAAKHSDRELASQAAAALARVRQKMGIPETDTDGSREQNAEQHDGTDGGEGHRHQSDTVSPLNP